MALIKILGEGKRIGALLSTRAAPSGSAVGLPGRRGRAVRNPGPINEHFDLVAFDPRGVGHFDPGIRCRTDAKNSRRPAPPNRWSTTARPGWPAIEQTQSQGGREVWTRWAEPSCPDVGTDSAADGYGLVRRALGDDQINYLGFSYGNPARRTYVNWFGERGCGRWFSTAPSTGPEHRGLIEKSIRVPGLPRLRRGLREVAGRTARWAPTRPVRRPLSPVGRTHAGRQTGPAADRG